MLTQPPPSEAPKRGVMLSATVSNLRTGGRRHRLQRETQKRERELLKKNRELLGKK